MATGGQSPSQKVEGGVPAAWRPAVEWNCKVKRGHVLCSIRCWKCCTPSSIHSWHLFGKCTFTHTGSASEIESVSRLILAFNSSNLREFVAYALFFKCPIDQNHKPHTLQELRYQVDIGSISEDELMRVSAHFLEGCRRCVDEGGCMIVLLCDFAQLWAAVWQGCCFQFESWGLGSQQLPSSAAVLRATLEQKALYLIRKEFAHDNILNRL